MANLLPPNSSSGTSRPPDSSSLIREWIVRFGIEHKEDITEKLPLWLEAFGGMRPEILEKLFRHALKTSKFFPKISEILAPLKTAHEVAAPEAAERAWELLLNIRREDWNPDLRDRFTQRLKSQSERFQQAARAASVFRDFESVDDLHTWAKKRFIESYVAFDEREQAQFLLPDGEIKNMIADAAKRMALPE